MSEEVNSGTCIHCGAHFGAHYQYCTVIVTQQAPSTDQPVAVQAVDQDMLLWLETAEYLLGKIKQRLKGDI